MFPSASTTDVAMTWCESNKTRITIEVYKKWALELYKKWALEVYKKGALELSLYLLRINQHAEGAVGVDDMAK